MGNDITLPNYIPEPPADIHAKLCAHGVKLGDPVKSKDPEVSLSFVRVEALPPGWRLVDDPNKLMTYKYCLLNAENSVEVVIYGSSMQQLRMYTTDSSPSLRTKFSSK